MSNADQKRAGTVVSIVVAVLLAGAAGVTTVCERRDRDRIDAAAGRLSTAEMLLARAADTTAADESADGRPTLLPVRDVAGTMQVLQAIGDACGVHVEHADAVASGAEGRQGFLVSGSGAPRQVCEFLATIEQHPRLMVVETARFTASSDGGLQFSIGLLTWHTEDLR